MKNQHSDRKLVIRPKLTFIKGPNEWNWMRLDGFFRLNVSLMLCCLVCPGHYCLGMIFVEIVTHAFHFEIYTFILKDKIHIIFYFCDFLIDFWRRYIPSKILYNWIVPIDNHINEEKRYDQISFSILSLNLLPKSVMP